MKTVKTLIFLMICGHFANAQCTGEIAIDGKEYCLISINDTNYIKTSQSYHYPHDLYTPNDGKLNPGYYIAYNQNTRRVALTFYVNQKMHVEGLMVSYHKSYSEKYPVACIYEVGLGDGNYAVLGSPYVSGFPGVFDFSVKIFEEINNKVDKKFAYDK